MRPRFPFLQLSCGLAAAAVSLGSAEPVADFVLPDVNPASVRTAAGLPSISPRNYTETISAWYFGAET